MPSDSHVGENELCVCVCSVMSDYFATSIAIACQALLFMEFSRQEYWSRLPFPSPGDLPDRGIKAVSLVSCIGKQVLYQLSQQGSSRHVIKDKNRS